MKSDFDFWKVSVSWTKYDIVRVSDLVESEEVLQSYYSGQAIMDPSVLRSALLLKELTDPLPEFWNEVMTLDLRIRKFFIFYLFLFSSGKRASEFSSSYDSPFRGVFSMPDRSDKSYTNIRSLLVESGLASRSLRRAKSVPFDGSVLLNETEAGPIFKKALECYFIKNSTHYYPDEFTQICDYYELQKIVGMSRKVFHSWLNGIGVTPSSIRSVSFNHFLCFDQPCRLDFDGSKEVYIIGENGDGKTLLLMAIYASLRGFRVLKEADSKYIGAFRGVIDRVKDSDLEAYDDRDQFYRLDSAPTFPNVFAYGVHRGRYASESDQSSFEQYGFMTLFNIDLTLRDPIDWLLKCTLEYPNHPELEFNNLVSAINELLEKKLAIKQEGSKILFFEKGAEVSFSELSEGYRSTIIFLCDLLIRLSKGINQNDNVFLQSGVVLIDEICLHLHPKWQLTIVEKLRRLFPNIQFIMTTHSPIVLLGSGEDAIIYRVIRNQGHTFVSEPYYRKDMDGMMLNTLVTSSIFDLDSAAMAGSSEDVITSDSYYISLLAKKVSDKVREEKEAGRYHFSCKEIDSIVDSIIQEEVGNDQNQ